MSTNGLFPSAADALRLARSNRINSTPKLYRNRPMCWTTRQEWMGPYGHGQSSKKKRTWLRRCESSAACQEKTSRPSRSIAASLVADHLTVVAAVAPLIVAADTSAVIPFRRYLPVGFFWWRHFILCYFIVCSAVLKLCSIRLQTLRFYSECCNAWHYFRCWWY